MASDPLIGTTVGGCEILEVIGQGGMGVIYKSRQKSLDRVIALKVLARHLASDINFVTRFQKEARAIARVNHPNILAVYDVGEDKNVNYMIMELIEGRSLAELQTERKGAIPWEEATDYVRQAAAGLEAAQSVGIIHRDIKPENLMVTKKNVVKVSDFGLAKESDASNTSVDAVMGTPAFMSPEQCDGKKVDGRSDIYSLGGTFYRLVSGRLPFEAETAMSMMYRHKHEALIPPHEVVPTVPHAISAVIVKMMAKKREQRYQTMTEVIDALDNARKAASPEISVPKASASAANVAAVPPAIAQPANPVIAPPGGAAPFGIRPVPMPGGDDGHDDDSRFVTGVPSLNIRPVPASGRMPVNAAPAGAFGGGIHDTSTRNILQSGMGIAPAGLGAPDQGYTAVAQGDEALGRGDRANAMKFYRQALASPAIDQATRTRVQAEIKKEVATRRQNLEGLLKKGQLVEASRECKMLAEIDPTDEFKNLVKEIDGKLNARRTLVNDVRTAIAASQFEKAIKLWDSTAPDLRDEAVGKQIEQLRSSVVPSLQLADQGDKLSEQGRLEEAVSAYEDALKLNPNCEPARIGLKDVEQKIQRVAYMLKEGFQHSLEQDYEKAVETWKPILQLRPGHPQAVKGIVDAYMAWGQNLRAHGDLEGALACYKGASEVDPQNRTAKRALEELTNLHDKEQALIDRAQESAARGRLGEALGYWKDVQRVNPTNKRAAEQIANLSKQRSSGLAKTLVVLVLMAIAGGASWQYVTEVKVIGDARTAVNGKKFEEAQKLLDEARILIQTAERDGLVNEIKIGTMMQEIERAEKEKRYSDAEQACEKLAQMLEREHPRQAYEIRGRGLMNKITSGMNAGSAAMTKHNWEEARIQFDLVSGMKIPANVTMPAEAAAIIDQADKLKDLAQAMIQVEIAKKSGERTKDLALPARKTAAELNLTEIVSYLDDVLLKSGFDPKKFDAAMENARNFLKDNKLKEALAALAEADSANKGNADVKAMTAYTNDLIFCGVDKTGGMVLWSRSNPLKNGEWNATRLDAFCVDPYEYPNKAGEKPLAGVSWVEAMESCRAAGKELCKQHQWTSACKGEDARKMFTYGGEFDAGKCNTSGGQLMASGAKSECRNALGIYDMSGNLAEWVSAGENDSTAWLMGGSFKGTEGGCNDQEASAKDAKLNYAGFRCCKPLPKQ